MFGFMNRLVRKSLDNGFCVSENGTGRNLRHRTVLLLGTLFPAQGKPHVPFLTLETAEYNAASGRRAHFSLEGSIGPPNAFSMSSRPSDARSDSSFPFASSVSIEAEALHIAQLSEVKRT